MVSLPVHSAAEPLPLSLREAIRMAVERNLDVRAELYNPAAFEADINRNRAIYDTLLYLKSEYNDATISPVGSPTDRTNDSQTFLVNSSISRLFWTGGTLALNLNNSYTGSNALIPEPNYWHTEVYLGAKPRIFLAR